MNAPVKVLRDIGKQIRTRTTRFEIYVIGAVIVFSMGYGSWQHGFLPAMISTLSLGGGIVGWFVYFGVLGWVAAEWARWDARRAERKALAVRPNHIMLRKELAEKYVHDFQVEGENGRWTRFIQFDDEVFEWCNAELIGDYEIHPPGHEGARLVTFENPADAFAFKIRWG